MVFDKDNISDYFKLLDNCKGVIQSARWHPESDVYSHSMQALRWAFRESIDVDLILAAMLHDVGKAESSKGHEKIAAEWLRPICSEKTTWLIENHMRIWSLILGDMRRRQKVGDLIAHVWLPELIMLARWDRMGRDPNKRVFLDNDSIVDKLNKCCDRRYYETD